MSKVVPFIIALLISYGMITLIKKVTDEFVD